MNETESNDESAEQTPHDNGTKWSCYKCGAEIRRHLSAYKEWDEMYTLKWISSSKDVEPLESGGKHPEADSRRFCSMDCLESFIQMDYQFPSK